MKAVLIVFALCISITCYGQLERGRKFAGMSIGVGGSRDLGQVKTNTFGSSLFGGYLLTDNMVVGGELSYVGRVDDANGGQPYLNHNNAYGVATFVRRYFLIDDDLYLYGQAYVKGSYSRSFQNEYGVISNAQDSWNYNASLMMGATYFVSHSVALEATIGRLGFTRTQQPGGWMRWDLTSTFILTDLSVSATVFFK